MTRPHGTPRLHQWLLAEKFRRSVTEVKALLPGAVVLSVCGGSGMDAEFLASAGARVVLAEISLGAARRARERSRRYRLPIVPVVADATRLPFADRSVDIAYVHDGLHHLEQPLDGLREMCRVAHRAVSITEPARAAVTSVAVRLGLALEVEEAGNRVERLTLAEIAQELQRHGFQVLRGERYAMYYRHRPGPVVRWLSAPAAFELTKAGFKGLNLLAGRFGNKLTVQAVRGGY
jgi:ubiquinone/menaquinone biosynthesis C-methylase UbiE